MDKKKQRLSGSARSKKTLDLLLAWHRKNGRHDFPWRRDHNPYAVLVSEFMLQQTTVATVLPRFLAWMKLFPTIGVFARASEQEVLAAWEGLGYYSRARRLHAAAKAIVENHGGGVPSDEENLLALPGVGPYTAAAIRAFAHDKPAVVLDTNIIRVVARLGNIGAPVDSSMGKRALEDLAGTLFPDKGCRAVASALMDLGATICTSRKPDCDSCPIQRVCAAEYPERLPAKSPRKVTTRIIEHRAWIFRGEKLYLEQSRGPRWKGLWILPELGAERPSGRAVAELSYPITRYRVMMKVYPAKGTSIAGLRGYSVGEFAALPIPTPHRKAINTALRAVAVE